MTLDGSSAREKNEKSEQIPVFKQDGEGSFTKKVTLEPSSIAGQGVRQVNIWATFQAKRRTSAKALPEARRYVPDLSGVSNGRRGHVG